VNKRILMALAAAAALSAPAWGQAPPATQPGAAAPPAPGAWDEHGGRGPHGGMMHGAGPHGDMMGEPGMMGGGMMGLWGWEQRLPDLSADQRKKITGIRRELRTKQFALMDKMHDDMATVNTYRGGKFDEQAARKAYDLMEKTHRQMFENSLDAQKRIDALLTPQQRQQLERWRGG
jgi:Spy/CpxP family protein refolding chaperone